nr:MAG TPA: Inositol phospholipid synthesis and fat-storage-inducing TM [Bacteriophage sp.]
MVLLKRNLMTQYFVKRAENLELYRTLINL